MYKSASVFRLQFALFLREKGMLIFYLLCIAVAGIIAPVFSRGMGTAFSLSGLLTVMFLKPILSDSIAGEREKKTLEPLLSAAILGKSIIWGKLLFSVLFAAGFFTIIILFTVVTKQIMGEQPHMAAWQWICLSLLSLLCFLSISISGTYFSAVSGSSRIANRKVTRIAYPFGLLLVVYFSVVFLGQIMAAVITGLVVMPAFLCTTAVYAIKISKLSQSDYFEHIRMHGKEAVNKNLASLFAPKSQFGAVFWHEIRYLLTLKALLINFLGLCFAPAIVVALNFYYTGELNLYYAVLLTALMMPRTPTNLIAYSIGGEKTYRTGEALLSTPLHVRPLFLAKSMIPILVSTIMLILSSLITLAVANCIGLFIESGVIYRYRMDQLVLLIPVSIMSCITMVFITGIFSVQMKTPRQGLYVSSILGIIFVVPPSAIIYLTANRFLWSVLYFVILLLCNGVCVKFISDKIARPQIMSKL